MLMLLTVGKKSQSAMGFLNPNARSGEDKEKRLRKNTTITASLNQVLHHFDSFWVKKTIDHTDHSGVTFFLEKDGNDATFSIVLSGCLSFPLVSNTNQVNASLFLCRLVYMVWYPEKSLELQGVLIGGSRAGRVNWCEAPPLVMCRTAKGSNHSSTFFFWGKSFRNIILVLLFFY